MKVRESDSLEKFILNGKGTGIATLTVLHYVRLHCVLLESDSPAGFEELSCHIVRGPCD